MAVDRVNAKSIARAEWKRRMDDPANLGTGGDVDVARRSDLLELELLCWRHECFGERDRARLVVGANDDLVGRDLAVVMESVDDRDSRGRSVLHDVVDPQLLALDGHLPVHAQASAR